MPKIRAASVEEHKEMMRAAILAAAETELTLVGYRRFSLANVATTADIGRSTLYSYFATKDELIMALAAARSAPVVADVLGTLPAAGSPVSRLLALLRACLEVAASRPDLVSLYVVAAGALERPMRDAVWGTLLPIRAAMLELVREACAQREYPDLAPETALRIVGELVVGGVEQLREVSDPQAALDAVAEGRLAAIERILTG